MYNQNLWVLAPFICSHLQHSPDLPRTAAEPRGALAGSALSAVCSVVTCAQCSCTVPITCISKVQGEHLLLSPLGLCFKAWLWFKLTLPMKTKELCTAAHMQVHFIAFCLNVDCWLQLKNAAFWVSATAQQSELGASP